LHDGVGQHAGEAAFDDPAEPFVHLFEPAQSLVKRDEFVDAFVRDHHRLVEGEVGASAAAFGGVAFAGIPDQHAPHHPRGDGKEMGAVLPRQRILAYHVEIGFVDEGCRVEGVVGAFVP